MTTRGTGLFPELGHHDPIRTASTKPIDDSIIGAAVMEGKILPHRIAHYRERFKKDPEGTHKLLTSLAPGLPYARKRDKEPGGTGLFPSLGR